MTSFSSDLMVPNPLLRSHYPQFPKKNPHFQLLLTILILPILTNTCFNLHPLNTLKESFPCKCIHSKICPIHILTQSFPKPNNNLSYPIITLANCKSSNLVYQLQSTKCNVFHIEVMLSKHMNGHQSTCKIMDFDPSVPIHTISQQLHFQECWSIHVKQ